MSKFQSFLIPQIESFIRYRVASQKWNSSDERTLRYFDLYCAKNYPDAKELSQEMVDSWCKQRDSEQNNSCRIRLRVVTNFISYLRLRNKTYVTPPVMPVEEACTFIPHAFSDDELLAFFNACDNLSFAPNRLASRTRKITVPVFFRLLYSSGIRTCEARVLRVVDVDLQHGILNIQKSKGHDQHYVVLHDTMLELMRKYNMVVNKLYPDRTYFFPVSKENYFSSSWPRKIFRQLWKMVSDTHAIPYTFRHNYATTNINSWVDEGFGFEDKLQYLSKSMGHRDFQSTKYYYSLVPQFADILEEKTNASFEEIVPEVVYEKVN